jgi:hypothetical protein
MDMTKEQAAVTKAGTYPGYVNLRQEGDRFLLTVRADPGLDPEDGATCGATSAISLSADDIRGWLAQAHRVVDKSNL